MDSVGAVAAKADWVILSHGFPFSSYPHHLLITLTYFHLALCLPPARLPPQQNITSHLAPLIQASPFILPSSPSALYSPWSSALAPISEALMTHWLRASYVCMAFQAFSAFWSFLLCFSASSYLTNSLSVGKPSFPLSVTLCLFPWNKHFSKFCKLFCLILQNPELAFLNDSPSLQRTVQKFDQGCTHKQSGGMALSRVLWRVKWGVGGFS